MPRCLGDAPCCRLRGLLTLHELQPEPELPQRDRSSFRSGHDPSQCEPPLGQETRRRVDVTDLDRRSYDRALGPARWRRMPNVMSPSGNLATRWRGSRLRCGVVCPTSVRTRAARPSGPRRRRPARRERLVEPADLWDLGLRCGPLRVRSSCPRGEAAAEVGHATASIESSENAAASVGKSDRRGTRDMVPSWHSAGGEERRGVREQPFPRARDPRDRPGRARDASCHGHPRTRG